MKKKIIIVSVIVLVILLSVGGYLYISSENKKEEEKKNKEELIATINSHYNEYVITNKETIIYEFVNDTYEEVIKLNKDIFLELAEVNIDENTVYFKVKSDYEKELFIKYEDVEKSEKIEEEKDSRYLSYIPFNENVVLNNTKLYKDDNWLYQISNLELPILKKDNERYYIEFDGELLSVLKSEVEVKESNNTDLQNSTGIPVVVYHFFYDAETDNTCNEIICHPTSQLESHLTYLKENDYFTPTMAEIESYIDGNLRLPEKSVLITIDDGARARLGIDILDRYELNGTLFLITSWNNPDDFRGKFVELHSHGHDLHNPGVCPGGQGGGIKCLPKETLLNDLKTSSELLGNSTVFCYPFYEYNSYAIEVLKEAGFTMAFGGYMEDGKTKIVPGINKYKLPRTTLYKNTTLEQFINTIS